jgi:prevent-host-death family protein
VIERSQTLSVADAKRHFSEVLGRVAHANARITITRRGKPIAVIVSAVQSKGLSRAKGWLDDRDPFFAELDRIAAARKKHVPRTLAEEP